MGDDLEAHVVETVLVGVPTFAGDASKREIFFNYLSKLSYPDLRFVFATNSGEEDKKDLEAHAERVGIKIMVLINDAKAEDFEQEYSEIRLGHIVNNRNLIREYFLVGKYQWLYFIDSDCLGPTNAIQVARSHNKHLVTGWYLAGFNYDGKERVLPVAYAFDKPGHARQLAIRDVLQPRFLPIACAGLGCCLIHRNVMEKIVFRCMGKGGEDAAFFKDARDICDEKLWLDTRISFWHLKFPPTDPRSHVLDPRRYKLKKE